jgi:hypothetical protein
VSAARAHEYDVVLLSDLRYPGGNSASIAEEIKAQSRAGYTTALVDVRSPHMVRRRVVNRKIARCLAAGLADLVPAAQPVRARALIVRQPRLFTHDPETRPRVQAGVTVLVANQPPVDGLCPPERPYYVPAEVQARAEALFGDVLWAPIGPLVRRSLSGAPVTLRPDDWVNVVDVDEWRVDRDGLRGELPVIGRHSRGHQSKWPDTAADLLAAYPPQPDVRVEILGGAEPARELLGAFPANWTVHPFGSMTPRRFLSLIDVFVYFHHPAWVEAFGRNIVEAMASGAPAIIPAHFEPLFGEGAEYAQPSGVRELVDALRDPARYRERSRAATELVAERFGAGTHARRLSALIGEPSGRARHVRPRPSRRVLCVAPETYGAGATSRLLAVAAAMPDDVEPVVLTAQPALDLASGAGVLYEHLPGGDAAAMGERIADAARRHEADAVLIDADEPDEALLAAVRATTPLVWLRTGPGDGESRFAAVARVGLPESVLAAGAGSLDRETARAAIGASERLLALLAPGADERLATPSRVRLLARLLLDAGWDVVVPQALVADEPLDLPPEVARPRLRPLAGHLAAFDAAVASPGRTIVGELAAARVPSLLVPMRAGARAPVVDGIALAAARFDEPSLAAAVAELSDAAVRQRLADACAALAPRDAAPEVVAIATGAGR